MSKPDPKDKSSAKDKALANEAAKTPPAKPAKEPKPKKTKVKPEPVKLPLMVEMIFDFAGMFLIMVDAIVLWVSWSSGATVTDIMIRLAISTIIVGSTLWFFSKVLSSGALEAAKKSREEEKNVASGGENPAPESHLAREA